MTLDLYSLKLSPLLTRLRQTNPPIARWTIATGTSTLLCLAIAPSGRAQLPDLPNFPAGTPTPTVEVSPVEPAYTLGAGDRVAIDIFNVPEYSTEYQVLVDGTINFPLIGTVSVEGLTLEQAAEIISARYQPFLARPIVTVTLVSPRPLSIGIAGEVSNPGSYKMTPIREEGKGLQFPTLVQALELAGGLTPAAALRQIEIRRPQRVGPDRTIAINLWEFFQTGDLRKDISLRDGDTIFVPTSNEINATEVRQRATANFSADINVPVSIAVVGEVNRPGPYTLFGGDLRSQDQDDRLRFLDQGHQANRLVGLPTVTRALKVAGGITRSADLRRVQIRRQPRAGSEQIIDVNLWKLLQTGDISQDVLLQDGDTIIVPGAEEVDPTEAPQVATASFAPNSIQVSIVGEVVSPGRIEVPPNSSLIEGLMAAGSFDHSRAKKGSIELLRLNDNGTVSRRTIEVNLSEPLDEENNPTLRNDDVIIVDRSGVTRVADTARTVLSPFVPFFGVVNFVDRLFD